mmetsp:Transcript_105408/g.308150  ORF Transcript_105408/g.308150 Transcript_105408/m.308150 type:complete len:301 (+) Transcript_105408:81-983(+)
MDSQRAYVVLSSYSWNIFRYIGDGLRAAACFALLSQVCFNRSVAGFSRSTQVLILLLCTSRYLDLFVHEQHMYLIFFKLYFIGSALLTLVLFCVLSDTYDKPKDTCSLGLIVVPSFLTALYISEEPAGLEVMWTFSQMLEGFAMVPQYIFSYRDDVSRRRGVVTYMMCMGVYRTFYVLNWLYKKHRMPHYVDVQSWIGGAINICFFLDYLMYQFMGASALRRLTLGTDDGIHRVSHELRQRFGACLLAPTAEEVRSNIVELGLSSAPQQKPGYAPVRLGASSEAEDGAALPPQQRPSLSL